MEQAATKPRTRTSRGETVGQAIARELAGAGVEWAFTVPGESFLGVLDALPGAGIRVVATRHEGGASFMAEAVGQLTDKPAAVLGTRAVGASNMAIGIHTARQNSTPLVALVGQVRREFIGREAFQEVDLVGSFGRLAKWAAEIDDPRTATATVADGLRTMTAGRPGPILFSLPEDVLDLPATRGPRSGRRGSSSDRPAAPDPATVKQIVELLSRAKRPAILAGGGVIRAGATDALVELSERLKLPVFASFRRPSVFPNDHPHYLGMTGYGSPEFVRTRISQADALLVIGCRLSELTTFDYRVPARRTRWAHVDLEPRTAHSGLDAPDVALGADAADFLRAAIEAAGKRSAISRERVAALESDRQKYVAGSTLDDGADWRGPGIHPGRTIATLQRVLPDDALLTTDAGNFALWFNRGFRFGRHQTYLGPTSGAMGYGLPAAIAASLCEPNRSVVALCGDGGFAMTMNEMETAVREGAKPVILVFDNRRYGTIAMHQHDEGRAPVATNLGPIDFAAVARASGAQGGRVARDAEFEPALRDALRAGGPALLHLEMDPRWVTPDRFEG